MKRRISYAVLGVIFLCLTPKSLLAANAENRIFPVATGLTAQIKGQNVNVRSYPDTSARILKTLNPEKIKVIGKRKDWYKVSFGNQVGWVHGDYISVARADLVPQAKTQGEEIVSYGIQFIGTPYVWGGNSLKRGVDCSGLTQQVFKAFDIDISRVSYMQAEDGRTIPKSHLQTGDLVFFDTNGVNTGAISHVGIYVGENKFLHADSTHGVMISNLNSDYYTRNYVKSVRVLS